MEYKAAQGLKAENGVIPHLIVAISQRICKTIKLLGIWFLKYITQKNVFITLSISNCRFGFIKATDFV